MRLDISGPVRAYSRSLYRHTWLYLIVPLLLTGLIPSILLVFFPIRLTKNAEIGFDTRDTKYSGPRVAWQMLQQTLITSNRIRFANPKPIDLNVTRVPMTASEGQLAGNGGHRTQAQAHSVETLPLRPPATLRRRRRSWADQLLAAFSNVPCYDTPIPLMEHLSQVVIELPSYESIFNMQLLKTLCSLQSSISPQLAAFESYTPYKNVWHIANFLACLSPNGLVNCTQLTVADVETVKGIVDECKGHRRQIIECKLKGICNDVPTKCSSQMMFDLFYRLLPMSLDSRPFYLNTFLPVFTSTGYATQSIVLPLKSYINLEQAIMQHLQKHKLKMKGLLMDIKRERLLAAAISDSLLALLAAFLVMTVVALNSRSPLYALIICLVLFLSVLASLSIYALFTPEFPLLNLVVFVLLIAVGSDDAFILHSAFPVELTENSFYKFFTHISFTMFLTSFSTAVPFFANIFSNVIVFRCFGLFAGVTSVINYLLVVSFLPAFLVIQRRYLSCLPSLPHCGSTFSYSIREILPAVLVQGRFIWLSALTVISIGCTVIALRDLHLPEYNPLQLFINSNPHEWYDNNAERYFEFVSEKIALPLSARLVWGVQPVTSTAIFKADAHTPLRSDHSFNLTTTTRIKQLAATLKQFRSLPFVNHSFPYWPERFLEWSRAYPCSPGFLCCNLTHSLFSEYYMDFCMRNSTSFIFTAYNDTPLFDNLTFALVGYTALLPTKLKYNHRFSLLSQSFNLLDLLTPEDGWGWWITEWSLMSTWYDLLQSIISDSRSSVISSVLVVGAFAFLQLKWQALTAVITIACIIATASGIVVLLGWVIGVLEAVILVLVVGLSFDYTLHYGAAVPAEGCPLHRIREAASLAICPVSLSAFTSFLAGASMLFSSTHAFFQVGEFLVVISIVSWLFATFFYLPLLSLTLPRSDSCIGCKKINNNNVGIPLNRKN